MRIKAASTHKKVVVETFAGGRLPGYLNLRQFDRETGFEFLDPGGQLQKLPWRDVKVAWFVRDWDDPPRPALTAFLRRPRVEGLWVRLRFRDDERLEGVMVNDLLHASPHGYLVTPPDLNSAHQKAFVPREALAAFEILAVIPNRGEHHPRRPRPAAVPAAQQRLFNE
jgi:hypothetical protein